MQYGTSNIEIYYASVLITWVLGHCSACKRKWRLRDTDLCPCGETQTMFHIVESCPLTKLNGGLSRLHFADEDTVSWLTNYGSWHAYEKKTWVLLVCNVMSNWSIFLQFIIRAIFTRPSHMCPSSRNNPSVFVIIFLILIIIHILLRKIYIRGIFAYRSLLLLVCVSFTIIGQPRNSVLIRRV